MASSMSLGMRHVGAVFATLDDVCARGNQSVYLHHSGPLPENGLTESQAKKSLW